MYVCMYNVCMYVCICSFVFVYVYVYDLILNSQRRRRGKGRRDPKSTFGDCSRFIKEKTVENKYSSLDFNNDMNVGIQYAYTTLPGTP